MGDGDNYTATDAPSAMTSKLPSIRPIHILPTPKPQPIAEPEPQPTVVPSHPTTVPVSTTKPKLTQKQFEQQNPTRPNASKTATHKTAIPQIDTKEIASALGDRPSNNHQGGARGTAQTRLDADAIAAYVALLRQRLHDAQQNPEGVGDRLETRLEFYLGADGGISGLKIIGPSGNPAFDQSVLAAFGQMVHLPPAPTGYAGDHTLAFKVREDD
jgi:TonB family protein